jgi:predicted phosphodiesterase
MRVQYLSDLHFEFHADAGASFVAELAPEGIDVLVLAGDIAVGEGIGPALDLLCARYHASSVVYVHGNHELYGGSREDANEFTREACARHSNLHWLDGAVIEIAGRRFLGAPMWFRHPGKAEVLKSVMNDFARIVSFEDWVYDENARALDLLQRELREGDVVVTHHLPGPVSVAPEYVGHPLNAFFVCDVEDLVRARRPKVWIHGHTHATVDATLGETRVLCNPFGYLRHEINASFRRDAVVEI